MDLSFIKCCSWKSLKDHSESLMLTWSWCCFQANFHSKCYMFFSCLWRVFFLMSSSLFAMFSPCFSSWFHVISLYFLISSNENEMTSHSNIRNRTATPTPTPTLAWKCCWRQDTEWNEMKWMAWNWKDKTGK